MPKGSTDRRFRRHLKALTGASNLQANQPANRARTDIPVSSKLVRDSNPLADSTDLSGGEDADGVIGGGIAPPITEPTASARTTHPSVDITSTDALFVIQVEPVMDIEMIDSTGQEVKFTYDDPYNPAVP